MSLFRLKDWWSVQLPELQDLLDRGSLCVGNLSNNPQESDKIVLGGLNGILRIYDPCTDVEDTMVSNVSIVALPEHLQVEQNLQQPVLQLAIGRGSERNHLAVLHPRKLSVFSFTTISGQAEHGNQYGMSTVHEHNLKRAAYNMCHGAFGGAKGRDFICIQSLDGALSFYEQESFVFSRFLPSSMTPGPLAYAPASDSFITVSQSYQVESYKYQVLAVAVDSGSKEEAEQVTTGKRVAIDWSLKLGEAAVDLCVVEISPCTPSILVLGERNIFCITEGGFLRYMKKLDASPTCLIAYTATSEGWIQYIVGTDTNTLLLFCDATLKWAVQIPFCPTVVRTGKFGFVKGLLVSVSDAGQMLCGYLGTDPALYGLPRLGNTVVNHAQRQLEFASLQRLIKSAGSDSESIKQLGTAVLGEGGDELVITYVIPSEMDRNSLAHDSKVSDERQVPSITVTVTLNANRELSDLQLHIYPLPPLAALQRDFTFTSIAGTKEVQATFYLMTSFPPSSMEVPIEATFSVQGGVSKSVKTSLKLPIGLVAKSCSAPSNALHKITIDSSKPAINLNDIFPDIIGANEEAVHSLGFQLFGNGSPRVSILVSKHTNKYRVQSDNFELIWLFMSEIIDRLYRFYGSNSGLRLRFAGQLPLAEYFAVIDHHFELRKRQQKLEEVLALRCDQLRAVQRRLLSKYKDVTPAPLAHLDGLLEMSYRQIISLGTALQELTDVLQNVSAALMSSTNLIVKLISMSVNLQSEQNAVQLLRSALAADTIPSGDWEDKVELSVSHLLQRLSGKASSEGGLGLSLEQLTDTSMLKRHITVLCERIFKGALDNLMNPQEAGKSQVLSSSRVLEPITENSNIADIADTNLRDMDIPIGSSFGEMQLSTSRERELDADIGQDDDFTQLGSNAVVSEAMDVETEIIQAQKHEYLQSTMG